MTDMLQRQRSDLRNLMRGLSSEIETVPNVDGARHIIRTLESLYSLTLLHNAQKWVEVYYPMIESGDPRVSATATDFHHEETELFAQLGEFVARWTDPNLIVEQAAIFCDEAKHALWAIEDRGTREHSLLYSLAA